MPGDGGWEALYVSMLRKVVTDGGEERGLVLVLISVQTAVATPRRAHFSVLLVTVMALLMLLVVMIGD